MQNDAWFFVGIFVFIFLVWVATGGPTHPISFAGPTLAKPQELGGGTYLQLPRAPNSLGSSQTSGSGGGTNYSNYTTNYYGSSGSRRPLGGPLYGIPFGTPSPYTKEISLYSHVSGASTTKEYLQLSLSRNATAPVRITGWWFESQITGKSAAIPGGTLVPTTNAVNQKTSITLSPGEKAYIHTGGSPLGTSFRENKCTGYLNEFQDFTPRLSRSCPRALEELQNYYGPYYMRDISCVDRMKKIGACTAELFPSSKLSRTCRDFARQYLNYNGCVAAHKNDPDFAGKTWHIYLGYSKPLWRGRNEVIKLLDINGKTVGVFTY